MPMFDIENSKNVLLKGNKTSDPALLRARGVKNLDAVENEAGLRNSTEPPRRWAWFRDNVFVAVIGALLVICILGFVILFLPSVKNYLP